jgi:hypothetical protein
METLNTTSKPNMCDYCSDITKVTYFTFHAKDSDHKQKTSFYSCTSYEHGFQVLNITYTELIKMGPLFSSLLNSQKSHIATKKSYISTDKNKTVRVQDIRPKHMTATAAICPSYAQAIC